ncbi:hypothetical protein Fmac_008139 [Flemingia macrophylla]|uniref:Uncharacterized protein n=1 Tax=Flemingia macrophylla TaxID=520843 RepID=A0ABD1MWL8_9FABA
MMGRWLSLEEKKVDLRERAIEEHKSPEKYIRSSAFIVIKTASLNAIARLVNTDALPLQALAAAYGELISIGGLGKLLLCSVMACVISSGNVGFHVLILSTFWKSCFVV